MPAPFDNIVQHLFHQPSLQSVTVDELVRMADQHPYFAAAHFLLLKKMQETAHPAFNTQLHKTTLYFHNPLWLQFLLQPETTPGFTVSDELPFITNETTAPVAETVMIREEDAKSGMVDVITAVFNDDSGQLHQPGPAPENRLVQEEIPGNTGNDTQFQPGVMADEPNPGSVHLQGDTSTEISEPPAGEIAGTKRDSNFVEALDSMQNTDETADDTERPLAGEDQEGAPLLRAVPALVAAKSDSLFEPYHTVDYFASQGIKLSKMEAESKDKLGRQLKSFTEWLKTMKKLPQSSIDKILAENEESKVVEDAIHSIENKEVITEAMAEVFEKQGLHDKAAEVYQKLSLLNPGKTAYFAAKIAILKH